MTETQPESWRLRLARWLAGERLAAVTARVSDEDRGWAPAALSGAPTGRGHDYDPARVLELYTDSLTAWRRNPIAWRIIAITSDYVVGDRVQVSSSNRHMARFIDRFWNHPKNRMDLRLEAMSDELARAGDLFVLLFRNEQDGMSYIRFVTKDRIQKIETAPNDWETELVYYERRDDTLELQEWLSPAHPQAAAAPAVMLHYAVNRPMGALLGEGDLTTMLPWLQRYSRMLEDRVRLHWAVRAFLWLVTVPGHKVKEKQEQYRTPPESGSIVVKDETETWEPVAPNLRGVDAQYDLYAVRAMIDAGSGYPPHWRGEATAANLATATAMQAPTERHLLRRRQYFIYMLQDILYTAYQRAGETGGWRRLPDGQSYDDLFLVKAADISRADSESLARAAKDLAEAFRTLTEQLPGRSPTLNKLLLRLVLRFAGAPQDEETLAEILKETQHLNS